MDAKALRELDQYELLSELDGGSSARVFKARAPDGAQVAIKVARTPEFESFLADEAYFSALDLAPGLPRLFDAGRVVVGKTVAKRSQESGAVAFLAFEWLEADADKAFDLLAAQDIAETVADLHAAGLAHGDIKPANLVRTAERMMLIDLGLTTDAWSTVLRGATPRYLGPAPYGTAAARDLFALGLTLAELASPGVRSATPPVENVLSGQLPSPLGEVCRALCAPMPGARPSARWAARMLAGTSDSRREGASSRRAVRAAYLRLRWQAGMAAAGYDDPALAPWAAEAFHWNERISHLLGHGTRRAQRLSGDTQKLALPLNAEQIQRWLLALCGPSAASWPMTRLATMSERALAEHLSRLADEVPPSAWTLADVEAVGTQTTTSRRGSSQPLDAENAAALTSSLLRSPPDGVALATCEHAVSLPAATRRAAADALRRLGEPGRALTVLNRGEDPEPTLVADLLRRQGHLKLALRALEGVNDRDRQTAELVAATRARIHLDAGSPQQAQAEMDRESGEPTTTFAGAEVRSRLALLHGERDVALTWVSRAEATADDAEQRARALGLRGFALHGNDAAGSRHAYQLAAQYAAHAGAVVEEATYLTGQAASAIDDDRLGEGIQAARRSALLWESRGEPSRAARAWLNVSAGLSSAGKQAEAIETAQLALEIAREANDALAKTYSYFVIFDATEPSSPNRVAIAERCLAAANASHTDSNASDETRLRAQARALRAGLNAEVHEAVEPIDVLDEIAVHAGASPSTSARLEWWEARLRSSGPSAQIVRNVLALLSFAAPASARGPTLDAALDAATSLGDGDAARRLAIALRKEADRLVERCGPSFVDGAVQLPWVRRARETEVEDRSVELEAEQARQLDFLVRSLGERESLRELLRKVVDALVMWTGVERGVLLLPGPNGRLVPRAARNLARADLKGPQLELSLTLARRAQQEKQPVVAVDAAGELATVVESVHALQLRSVLAVPLLVRGEVVGVVYLDDRVRRGAFGQRELRWTMTVAHLAALVVAEAHDQAKLKRAVRRAERSERLLEAALAQREAALDAAERELAATRDGRATRFSYDGIIGESASMQRLLRTLDRVVAADIPVLIRGESGSGKELIARAVHAHGPRKDNAFVSENCGAIPESLLESTLFGHVRGAFTGADRPRVGLFEVAHRGTLFLDEVGEMSLPMQAKLLRVLEDGIVRPLGTERTRRVDVRVVAATHRDLEKMVREKTFREDLYYRLNIITLELPPLRERRDDIPLLVAHMLEKHAPADTPRVSRAALDRLAAFDWPGNVRQLENEVRRALVLSDGRIEVEHLSSEIRNREASSPTPSTLNVRQRVDALEVRLVRDALEKTSGNQTQAARLLGLSRFGLQKMMKRLDIRRETKH